MSYTGKSALVLASLIVAVATGKPAFCAAGGGESLKHKISYGPNETVRLPVRRGGERWDGLDELFLNRRGREPDLSALPLPIRRCVIFRDAVTGTEKWYLGRVVADVQGPPYQAFNADGSKVLIRLKHGGCVLFEFAGMRALPGPRLNSAVWDATSPSVIYGLRPVKGGDAGLVRHDLGTGEEKVLCQAGTGCVLRTPSDDGKRLLWNDGRGFIRTVGTDGAAPSKIDAGGLIEELGFTRGKNNAVFVRVAGERSGRILLLDKGTARALVAPAVGLAFGPDGAAVSEGSRRWPADGKGKPQALLDILGNSEHRWAWDSRDNASAMLYAHSVPRSDQLPWYSPYDVDPYGDSLIRVKVADGSAEVIAGANDNHPAEGEWEDSLFLSVSPDGTRVFYLSTMLGSVGAYVATASRPTPPADVKAAGKGVTGVKVTRTGRREATLTWASAQGIRHYNVYASSTPDFECSQRTLVGSAPAGVAGFQDVGLLPDTTVYYRICTVDAAGAVSKPSSPLAVRTQPLWSDLPVLDVVQVEKAPKIDGRLNDACWKTAGKTAPFTDRYGFPAKNETIAYVCQKGDILYIGLRCPGNEKGLGRPTKAKAHDERLWVDESVELFIDPDADETPGLYQLSVSIAGLDFDAYCPEAGDIETRWEPRQLDPRYANAVHKTATEWTVEYALPLTIFNKTKIRDEMRVNFTRVDMSGRQGLSWSPLRGEKNHLPHRFGTVRGVKGLLVTSASPAEFVKTPKVNKEGRKVSVDFSADRRTDVAVWVEDEEGNKVRHLAAGLLGATAPAPLQKNALAQSLSWDMNDDFGNAVPAGKYRVHVGLGLKAQFDRMIGWDRTPDHIVGMGIGPGGHVFIGCASRQKPTFNFKVLRYNQHGKYLKTVYPPAANVPPERLRGMNIIEPAPGQTMRFGLNRLGSYIEGMDMAPGQNVLVTRSGQIIIMASKYPGYTLRFWKINGDGSLPPDFKGPAVKEYYWRDWQATYGLRFHIALDPIDEDVIYIAGLRETADQGGNVRIYNSVMKVRWGSEDLPETFLGEYEKAGKDNAHFNDPQGITFDADGNLWVADRGNNRVMIFSRSGRFIRSFEVASPYQVWVSKKTGESYVLSTAVAGKGRATKTTASLIKYSASNPPVPVARLDNLVEDLQWSMCVLIESGPRPALLLTKGSKGSNIANGATRICRIVDNGDALNMEGVLTGAHPVRGYHNIAAGWKTDVVGGHHWYDGITGTPLKKGPVTGNEIVAGRDGKWYVRGGYAPESVSVYDETGKLIESFKLTPHSLGRKGRGFGVSPQGDIYVLRYYNWASGFITRDGENVASHVTCDVYSKVDGKYKLTRQRVVSELGPGAHWPTVDIKGNIYVCDNIGRRIGQLYEDDLVDKLGGIVPDYAIDWDKIRRGEIDYAGAQKFALNTLILKVGTIFKFKPEGGALIYRSGMGDKGQWARKPEGEGRSGKNLDFGFPAVPAPDTPPTHWSSRWCSGFPGVAVFPRWQKGVEWEWLGVSPSTGRYVQTHPGCVCESSGIAVDDFSRVYAPAAHRQTIQVLDAASNPILKIGSYANADSYGPGSPFPEPAIPLRYPTSVVLTERAMYVADALEHRILRVKLGYRRMAATSLEIAGN
ncbi:MAG: hypothetical protein HQ559_14565 [Lentisphaerae bacterium]|nr:hypothetical protein [Lentisphaerota bacterium]